MVAANRVRGGGGALAFSVSVAAQWPSHPTPGVPRSDNGSPVLDGPPRTADGKVDFSGASAARQIVQTPNLTLITCESNYGLRYIYTDGRPAPDNDPQPWWFGYSHGWWEGDDALVVETTDFPGDERAGWRGRRAPPRGVAPSAMRAWRGREPLTTRSRLPRGRCG